MMYGVAIDDLRFTDDSLSKVYGDDEDEYSKSGGEYESEEDFLSAETGLDKTDCGGTMDYLAYVGIAPKYSWREDDDDIPRFKTQTEAAEYIAKKIAPFVLNNEDEIRKLCQYVCTVGCD